MRGADEVVSGAVVVVGSELTELGNSEVRLSFRAGVPVGLSFAGVPAVEIAAEVPDELFHLKLRAIDAPQTTNYGLPGVQSGGVDVGVGCFFPLDGCECRYRGGRRFESADTVRLESDFEQGDAEFTLGCTLRGLRVEFDLELRWRGAPAYLYELGFRLPALRFGASPADNLVELYDIRNHSCALRVPLDREMLVLPGIDRIPDRAHRLTAMDNDTHHEVSFLLSCGEAHLFGWGFSPDGEALCYNFSTSSRGLSFAPVWWSCDRLEAGRRVAAGKFVLTAIRGDHREMRRRVAAIKREYGWTVPHREIEPRYGALYQIHGFVADGGTFSERMAELPELKKLGVSVIYLPPLSGPEAYLNNHPAELAPGYGSESELRAYVGAAHRLGMLVIADMIAHHLFTLSGIWREHPEFLRHDEHGNPLSYSIGSMLTATQHPGYRRFYLDCCRSLIERFDLDGFRFDVAGFQLPDWNEDKEGGDRRPGMNILAQSGLLHYLHAELSRIKPVIFLEEGLGVTGLRYVSHGILNFLRQLKFGVSEEVTAKLLRRLRMVIDDAVLKERPNVITAWHSKIHDTALLQGFGRNQRGIDLAWTFLCCTGSGLPFLSEGSEAGIRREIAALMRFRRELPEFGIGEIVFDGVESSVPTVFSFLRRLGERLVLVAINFSARPVSVRLSLDFVPDGFKLLFASRGARLLKPGNDWCEVELGGYGCLVMKLDGGEAPPSFSAGEEEGPLRLPLEEATSRVVVEDVPAPRFSGMAAGGELDEGSFSKNSRSVAAIAAADPPQGWEQSGFDDRDWLQAWAPATRTSFIPVAGAGSARFIEDISPYEINALWGRSPRLREGLALFRRTFLLSAEPEQVRLRIGSPAFYDFDLAVASGGITPELASRSNRLRVYVNGMEVVAGEARRFDEPLAVDPSLFRAGENLLAVAVERGNGDHGFIARLEIDGETALVSDLKWRCFPGRVVELGSEWLDIGENFGAGRRVTIRRPEGVRGVLRWSLRAAGIDCCRLLVDGRVFTDYPAEVPVVKRNSYSGAVIPLLRSDEFSPAAAFELELLSGARGVRAVSELSGQIGMVTPLSGGECELSLLTTGDQLIFTLLP